MNRKTVNEKQTFGTMLTMNNYQGNIRIWREDYQSKLLAPQGWLSTVALVWLEQGKNLIGSSNQSLVPLDARVPDELAVLSLEQDRVHFQTRHQVRFQDKTIKEMSFELEDNKNSEYLHFGDFAFSVLRRGAQYGLRIFDVQAHSRLKFKRLNWFPTDPAYCLEARFKPYESPKPTRVTTIIGGTYEAKIPGDVEFYLGAKQFRLLPVQSPSGLSFVFKDLSSQDLTYPPGRFLNAEEPKDGLLTLDFNKAYNPPCAFTPFATCPLPLAENHLDVQILAGEKRYTLES